MTKSAESYQSDSDKLLELSDQDSARQPKGGRILGRILPAAVRLWLRSQVEQVEELSLALAGGDRDIISGRVPGVAVSAQKAIYKGIHIGQLQLSAQDIRINVGQVIRGKPLRLLQAFPIRGEVALSASDLNASLASPLLAAGLGDFWRSLVTTPSLDKVVRSRYGQLPLRSDVELRNPQIRLGNQLIGLSFYPQAQAQTTERPIILGTSIAIILGNRLQLESPRWLESLKDLDDPAKGIPIDPLQHFQWDFGEGTQLTALAVKPEKLLCSGQLTVSP